MNFIANCNANYMNICIGFRIAFDLRIKLNMMVILLFQIQLVTRKGDGAEVLSLFEKAVGKYANCPVIWSAYIEYLSVVDFSEVVPVFQRARKSLKKVC